MMRWRAVLITVALAGSVLPGCRRAQPPRADGPLTVAASIFPIADVVARIGGQRVQVVTLMSAGQSPHGFALSTGQVRQLPKAKLLVRVGMGLDQWTDRYVQTAGEALSVLTLAEHIALEAQSPEHAQAAHSAPAEAHEAGHAHEAHAAEGGDGHGHAGPADEHGHLHEGDPHIWLDPVLMQDVARAIARRLGELDGSHRGHYDARLQDYLAELRQLDGEYRRELSSFQGRHIVTYHQAFTYMAERYGLHAEAMHSIAGGAAESFGALRQLTDYMKRHDVKVIFTEPQFPPQRLGELARQSGARIAVLDPLGGAGIEGYDSYLAMMRSNLRTLVSELKQP